MQKSFDPPASEALMIFAGGKICARFVRWGIGLASRTRQDKNGRKRLPAIKSISNETTFFEDTSDPDLLYGHLWRMCEKVSAHAKASTQAALQILK